MYGCDAVVWSWRRTGAEGMGCNLCERVGWRPGACFISTASSISDIWRVWLQERILLLTDKNLYRLNYDFSYKTVSSTKAIPLVSLESNCLQPVKCLSFKRTDRDSAHRIRFLQSSCSFSYYMGKPRISLGNSISMQGNSLSSRYAGVQERDRANAGWAWSCADARFYCLIDAASIFGVGSG